MQCIKIFLAVNIENFQQKTFDVFNIFAQNTECWYTFERVPTIYVLDQKLEKLYTLVYTSFTIHN